MLDFLVAIRKCNDKFVIVTVSLAAYFIEQPARLALEKPRSSKILSAVRTLFVTVQRPSATIGSILDARYAGK